MGDDKKRLTQAGLETVPLQGGPAGISLHNTFVTELKDLQESGSRNGDENSLFIFYVDVLHLERLNAEFGHDSGDLALQWLQDKLREVFTELDRASQFVLRHIREDEFAIGCFTSHGQSGLLASSTSKGNKLAADLCHHIGSSVSKGRCSVQERIIPMTVSVGAALAPKNASIDQLSETLLNADRATRRARYVGILQSPVFDVADELLQTKRIQAVRLVKQALAAGCVEVHYQPKICLATGALSGVEALVRIRSSAGLDSALLYADEFIPFIEETSAIDDLGKEVIRLVVSDLARWADQGLAITAAVNLSSYQLRSRELVPQVLALMAATPTISASQLVFEVVETRALEDLPVAIETLQQFKNAGIESHLDDFGTGYSSFAYLKSLPVSAIKIDRSFVQGMLTNKQDEAIVKSFIGVAEAFGIKAIAEGIETAAEAARLTEWGCHVGQGYLISRPMPFAAATSWLLKVGAPRMRQPWREQGNVLSLPNRNGAI